MHVLSAFSIFILLSSAAFAADPCEDLARARLKASFPEASLEKPADIIDVERGRLRYVFGENYCIYTAYFANETCEKVVKTKRQCI